MDFSSGRAKIRMKEFGKKGSNNDDDFMIHKDYDMILDGLENRLMATKDDMLTIDVIREKLNHRCEKIKSKKR